MSCDSATIARCNVYFFLRQRRVTVSYTHLDVYKRQTNYYTLHLKLSKASI